MTDEERARDIKFQQFRHQFTSWGYNKAKELVILTTVESLKTVAALDDILKDQEIWVKVTVEGNLNFKTIGVVEDNEVVADSFTFSGHYLILWAKPNTLF